MSDANGNGYRKWWSPILGPLVTFILGVIFSAGVLSGQVATKEEVNQKIETLRMEHKQDIREINQKLDAIYQYVLTQERK